MSASQHHEDGDKQPYIETQRKYFDGLAGKFAQPIPEEILERTRRIVASANLGPDTRILDVATGAGALIVHFLEFGAKPQNIVGVDLSDEMLRIARQRFSDVFLYRGDFCDLRLPLPAVFPSHIELFDVVFFNGCFGNMFDQQEALTVAANLLAAEGQIVISHPLGARFVESLHRNEPHIVPHRLPDRDELQDLCLKTGLEVVSTDLQNDFYLANLRKKLETE